MESMSDFALADSFPYKHAFGYFFSNILMIDRTAVVWRNLLRRAINEQIHTRTEREI